MPPYAPVTVRCEAEINGMTIMVQQPVTQALWTAAQSDQAFMDAIREQLRVSLGTAIVQALDPEITVHLPTELDEAVMQRAMDELPEPDGPGTARPAPCVHTGTTTHHKEQG